MPQLSESGQQLVQSLSNRYGLSTDAVTHMLIAVYNGNGSMAQFNHPEFMGSGQWMRGGMTMVSDLFNNHLKNLVNKLCSDLANELANHQQTPFSGSFQSQSQSGSGSQSQAAGNPGSANDLFVPDPSTNWWPQELGVPSATGAQNNTRYAYFANSHRLAVNTGGRPWVYDTLDHQIGGFGQQQGGSPSITFTSQYGTVDLSTLPVVMRDGVPQSAPQASTSSPTPADPPNAADTANATEASPVSSQGPAGEANRSSAVASPPETAAGNGEDVIATLERLGGLRDKGYISEEEFAAKKSELLSRL
ncbi:SHOCT domain-containing protein [Roseiconus nitratireducens]|uniref:SHOCT domain-containing protein n=1 Tax=Roseiconus nitratireducens TaxID=2605748 RepID=A0A5M6D1E6_9BACT|nr:SHOCT domain-containing protein [Roseiconus nitratireducens]KAA5540460.1 SHOCT domain-containing protein [Roseiconus nitratireducens]